ncbi:MAG TPA: hypothetical protein VM869_05285 [Enhygromyxa sp.]|nr:hypothetical protein [Enhygromyxa sp.]
MGVFIAIGLVGALLHVVLLASDSLLATSIAYAIVGLLCGLALRTRLQSGVQRALVVCFSVIAFALAGPLELLTMISQASLGEHVSASVMIWALVGVFITLPFLGLDGRIFAPVCALMCFAAAGGLARWVVELMLERLHVEELGFFFVLGVGPLFLMLGAGLFDRICERVGLESPQQGLARLRVKLEFRLR